MNMLVMYTVSGCPAVRRAKQYLKEHDLPFEERSIYRVLLDHEATLEMLSSVPEIRPADDAAAYYAANPSALPKPVLVCDDGNLKVHLEELCARHCNQECIHWNMCGRVFKGEGI